MKANSIDFCKIKKVHKCGVFIKKIEKKLILIYKKDKILNDRQILVKFLVNFSQIFGKLLLLLKRSSNFMIEGSGSEGLRGHISSGFEPFYKN